MLRDIDKRRMLYGPSVQSMREHLPDLGEALHTAAIDLARDCSLERVDQMLARIKGAESNLIHLRKAMIAKQSTGHGTG